MDMNTDYLHELFSKVDYVSSICFTGGEPSLAPHVIEETIRIAKLYDTTIGNFYIATNAVVVPDAFIKAVVNLWLYCDENEISCLHRSNDQFHDEVSAENIDKLSAFRFAEEKYSKDYNSLHLINEGNAAANGIGKRDNGDKEFSVENGYISESEVYLNCKGNIIAGCDWSYESQDHPNRIVCRVEDFSLEKIEEYIDG
jgi:hypothetical protein